MMTNSLFLTRLGRIFYQWVGKPLLFQLEPEAAHQFIIKLSQWCLRLRLTKIVSVLAYSDPSLAQVIKGVYFPNPVGLAAGFDKNAELLGVLPAVGFGAVEVGSITARPCAGNPGRRLWRLPWARSLQVNYGLANEGVEIIAPRLRGFVAVPLGTSIAFTNSPEVATVQAAVSDYVLSFKRLAVIGDYFAINISCPNIKKADYFSDSENLNQLLSALDAVRTNKLIFLKISADWSPDNLDQLMIIAREHRVDGFICTNLTKDPVRLVSHHAPGRGGLSGKAVEDLSNNLIRHLYQKAGQEFIIIGCGGIFSAADAYEKIRAGASLVQLITGMIYEGPQLIGEINRGLAELLHRDGFSQLAEAVGSRV